MHPCGKEAVPMAAAGQAGIDLRELAGEGRQAGALDRRVRPRQVDPPPPQGGRSGRRGASRQVGKERRGVALHQVDQQAVRLLPGIHHVEGVAGPDRQPAQRRRRVVAAHDAQEAAAAGLPRKQRPARRRPPRIADQREQRDRDMAGGDREVVHQCRIRRLDQGLGQPMAVRVQRADPQHRRGGSGGVGAEIPQRAGRRVALRMGGEGTVADRPDVARQRFQRHRIEPGRRMSFLQCGQPAGMMQDAGVGGAARLLAGCVRLRAVRLPACAEALEQRPSGLLLLEPARRADPAVAVGDAAVGQREGMHHAVASEPVQVVAREAGIGTVAKQRAAQFRRQAALYRKPLQIALLLYGRGVSRSVPIHLALYPYNV